MAINQQETIEKWCKSAHSALAERDFAAVESSCKKILDTDPRNAEAHFLLAMLALETGQHMPAAKLLHRATLLAPERPEYFAQFGRVLVILQETNAARDAAGKALALQPKDALTLDSIGCIFSHAGEHETALPPFREAVRRQPDNPDFNFNLASSLRFLGDFDAAEQAYETAISAAPEFFKAHWSLAYLRRQTAENNHIERLQELLQTIAGHTEAEAFVNNALAKEFDDLGDTDQAFTHLSNGKQLIRNQLDYAIMEDQLLFDSLISEFSNDLPPVPLAGDPTDEPIFIVGMPRTGTTLVERILSSHTDVYAAGELRDFALQLKRATGTASPRVLDADTIKAGLSVNPEKLGRAYLESTRPATGHTRRFIDKTPLNFLNIGFIHRALPNARIICLRRNPMDTCLSNFRQMFSPDTSPYYKYSFDLLETGQYYLLFDKLMRHWDEVLPGKVLSVQYEDVVADQEAQSRRIVDFCGLEWQDACLAFEKNAAPVATASSVQVRQPIYSDATARWKRYEQHLQPLRELLEANGITV